MQRQHFVNKTWKKLGLEQDFNPCRSTLCLLWWWGISVFTTVIAWLSAILKLSCILGLLDSGVNGTGMISQGQALSQDLKSGHPKCATGHAQMSNLYKTTNYYPTAANTVQITTNIPRYCTVICTVGNLFAVQAHTARQNMAELVKIYSDNTHQNI